MSDNEEGQSSAPEKPFHVDRAKTSRAGCKKCKLKIESGTIRLAKVGANPFGDGTMKMWHHVSCLFEVFKKQRATTARINSPEDIGGWEELTEEDQEEILKHLEDSIAKGDEKKKNIKTPKKKADKIPKVTPSSPNPKTKENPIDSVKVTPSSKELMKETYKFHKDNAFREFRRLCADLSNEPSYTGKTALVKDFFTQGSDKSGFKGDLLTWCRLLLPGAVKRIYNVQSKQLVKLFSRILCTDLDEMLVDLEQGDVAETLKIFFEKSSHLIPAKKSIITMSEVDTFLEQLSQMTKEEEQAQHFKTIATKCTSNDLKMIIRLVKHDLRINAGPKHILEAVHQDAYEAFQASRDIAAILSRATNESASVCSTVQSKGMAITLALMTPVQPMLAEPCRAVEDALKKCPEGMYSEIKYDGERVQVHKRGNEFKYFSRSLKPVMQHKIAHFKKFIPEAFPHGEDLILDAEILMIDTKTGNPLPFGSLGVHKKTEFQDANVCLFVFDCIYFNGRVLTKTPMQERRQILESNMREIKHRVMLSEMEELHDSAELESMITKVFRLGLEGLVLKPLQSIYEPGKRHWLKVKKDYLFGGSMADSVDLVVLGAWFGTGSKGGMMSSFLMGVYDSSRRKWCTVTKVHGGHDDATLATLQNQLDMVKISKDVSRVPSWLDATRSMIPDFVAKDPCKMPVWEITGAEFTQHEVHTAHGISIRFPRVTKIREDKDWKTSTSLVELDRLYELSKESGDFTLKGKSPKTLPRKMKETTPQKKTLLKIKAATPQKSPLKLTDLFSKQTSTITSKSEKRGQDANVRKHKTSHASSSPNRDDEKAAVPVKKRKKTVIENPLPDFFYGVKLVIPKSVQESLERYLISYGGVSLPASKSNESTHVIYVDQLCDGLNWPKSARHVDIDWLRDSIKLRSLQETKLYAVHATNNRGD